MLDGIRLVDLVDSAGGRAFGIDPSSTLSGASIDSREVHPGMLFFALQGTSVDGHDYAGRALDAGAFPVVSRDLNLSSAILVDDVPSAMLSMAGHVRGSIDATVMAITGSTGKTTTRELTRMALETRLDVASSPRNWNNHLGLPLTLLNLDHSPEVLLLELGMNHAGELSLLGSIARPEITVVTNIGLAHLEYFDSRDDIARAKSELLSATKSGGCCVIPAGEPILESAASGRALDVRRRGTDCDAWFEKRSDSHLLMPEEMEMELLLEGGHNYANATTAVLAAELLGIPRAAALEAMSEYRGMPGRGRVAEASGITILDESYNANPDSVAACLDVLGARIESGARGFAVLGEMRELGETAVSLHRKVLEKADSMGISLLILVGPCYETASGEWMRTDHLLAEDWQQAWELLKPRIAPNSTVLVKGSHSVGLEKLVEIMVTELEEEGMLE